MASFPATGAGYGQLLADAQLAATTGRRRHRRHRQRRGGPGALRLAAGGVAVASGDPPEPPSAPAPRQVRSRRRRGGRTRGAVRRSVGPPKSADGPVEAIRLLHATRRCAVKARTVRDQPAQRTPVTVAEQVAAPALWGPGHRRFGQRLRAPAPQPTAARSPPPPSERCASSRAATGRSTARSRELDTNIARLCAQANPALLAARGVGPDVAATLAHRRGRQRPSGLTSEAVRRPLRRQPRRSVLGAHRPPPPLNRAATATPTTPSGTGRLGSPPLSTNCGIRMRVACTVRFRGSERRRTRRRRVFRRGRCCS